VSNREHRAVVAKGHGLLVASLTDGEGDGGALLRPSTPPGLGAAVGGRVGVQVRSTKTD